VIPKHLFYHRNAKILEELSHLVNPRILRFILHAARISTHSKNLRFGASNKPLPFNQLASAAHLHLPNLPSDSRTFGDSKMEKQYHRRAWALLIVVGSFIAAAAVWSLPEDRPFYREFDAERAANLNRHD
jgi:hypothetical protein